MSQRYNLISELNIEEQVPLFQIFMSAEPVFAEPLSVAGILLYRNKQYLDALRLLQKSLIIDIGLHESRYAMKLCAARLGSSGQDEDRIVRDGMIGPQKAFSWMVPVSLRETRNGINSYEKSLAEVNQWVNLHISDSDFFARIVDFLSEKIKGSRSESEISRLYSIKGHFLLANSYSRLNNDEILQLADKCYEKSNKLNVEGCRASSIRSRAEINFLLENYDAALLYSDESINCDPRYPYAYVTKGIIEWSQNEYSEAITLFSKAISEYLKMVNVKRPSPEFVNRIIEELVPILRNRSNEIDSRSEFRAWVLSSYYYGYCPFHPKETPYFNLQKRKSREYLRICHTLAKGEGDRKYLDCHSLIARN